MRSGSELASWLKKLEGESLGCWVRSLGELPGWLVRLGGGLLSCWLRLASVSSACQWVPCIQGELG